jgi:Na+-translocating ferredoxin:NAD+ oxidoreductase RnfD subunit
MLVMLSGIVTLVRLLQDWKAPHPMLVTLSGIVTLVRLLQPLKAPTPMLVTGFPS